MVASRLVNPLDAFGTKITDPTDPVRALKDAGALFGLKKVSLAQFSGGKANSDLHVVIRTDTGQAIGAVGNSYEPFTNRSFFVPTAEALIKETGARIDSVSILDDGTRAFMRLSWPADRNIVIGRPEVGDIVGRRCTLSTSHDGKWAGLFTLQLLRLICSNGMVAPIGRYETRLTHTVGGHQQLIDLQKLIPMIDRYIRQFQVASNILVNTPVDPKAKKTLAIVRKIVDPTSKAAERKAGGANPAQTRINRVMELFGGEQPGGSEVESRGTGWGLYQAANHFFTHEKGTRGDNPTTIRMQRFKSLLPGGPADKDIARAWSVVTDGLGVSERIAAEVAALN